MWPNCVASHNLTMCKSKLKSMGEPGLKNSNKLTNELMSFKTSRSQRFKGVSLVKAFEVFTSMKRWNLETLRSKEIKFVTHQYKEITTWDSSDISRCKLKRKGLTKIKVNKVKSDIQAYLSVKTTTETEVMRSLFIQLNRGKSYEDKRKLGK